MLRQVRLLALGTAVVLAIGVNAHALVTNDKMKDISNQVKDKVEDITTYGADEVWEVVNRNLGRLKELKALSTQTGLKNTERAQKMTELLRQMSEDYTKLANNTGSIEVNVLQRITELKKLLDQPNQAITDLEREIESLKTQYQNQPPEPDEARRLYKEQSLKTQLALMTGELATWRTFRDSQKAMSDKLEDVRRMVGTMILVLTENARIYEKAYRYARVNRDYNEAIESINSTYERIQDITSKLFESWNDLQRTMDEIMKTFDSNRT